MTLRYNPRQNVTDIRITEAELTMYRFREASLVFDSHLIQRDYHGGDMYLFVSGTCEAYKLEALSTIYVNEHLSPDYYEIVSYLMTSDEHHPIEKFQR